MRACCLPHGQKWCAGACLGRRIVTKTINAMPNAHLRLFSRIKAFLQAWRRNKDSDERHCEQGIGRTKIGIEQSVIKMSVLEVMIITKTL